MRRFSFHALPWAVLVTAVSLLAATVYAASPPESEPRPSCPTCKRSAPAPSQPANGGAKGQESDAGGPGGAARSPTPASADGPGCCARNVTTRIEVSPSVSKMVAISAWNSVIGDRDLGGGPSLDDCPLRVLILGTEYPNASLFKPDYAFIGNLAADEHSRRYTLTVQLMDLLHGAVVQSGRTSWTVPNDGHALDESYEAAAALQENVKTLAGTFMPLDNTLHEYEGMPRKAELEPEKDPIGAGKKMKIHLKNIRANTRKGQPQPWQRVLVKVEKGKLLNGTPQWDRYWNFPVGKGAIQLKYQAPKKCKRKQTETITVFNTCTIHPQSINVQPEEKIATTELDVMCVRGEFEFKYDCEILAPGGITVNDGYEHSVPFEVDFDEDPPSIEGEGELSYGLTAKKGTLGGGSRVTMSERPRGPRVYVAGGKIRIAVPGSNASAVGTYTPKGFKERNEWTDKKELFGELIKNKSGEEKLKWGYVETHARGGPKSKSGPWTFPLKDGYKREVPMEMSVGGVTMKRTFTIILHLEEDD